jgi:hypothetical protein
MLIIGLVAGNSLEREQVAAELEGLRKSRLGVLAMRENASGVERVRLLSQMLCFSSRNENGLILSNVSTIEEADFIRNRGGFLCHVYGRPSGEIPIRRCDLMVTANPGGIRHYLDPSEALSEIETRVAKRKRGVKWDIQ